MFGAALHGGEGGPREAAIATYTEVSNSTTSSPLFQVRLKDGVMIGQPGVICDLCTFKAKTHLGNIEAETHLGFIKAETHLDNIVAETNLALPWNHLLVFPYRRNIDCSSLDSNAIQLILAPQCALGAALPGGEGGPREVAIATPQVHGATLVFLYRPGCRIDTYEDSRPEAKEWEEVLVLPKDVSNYSSNPCFVSKLGEVLFVVNLQRQRRSQCPGSRPFPARGCAPLPLPV